MYKAMSNHISGAIQKGYALLPTEGEQTLVNKVAFKNFLAVDYRYSNDKLVSADSESVAEAYSDGATRHANYVMGFAVVRNPATIVEFSLSSKATTTRVRNKIVETLATVLSDVRVPKNRGKRSVFIETTRKDGFADIEPLMKQIGLDPTKNLPSNYIVLPFFLSTTVYFNNFRAKVGVGDTPNGMDLLRDDVMRRLPNAFKELDEKVNRRLLTALNSSLFVDLVLVSPEKVADDSFFKSCILDYALDGTVNVPQPTTQSLPPAVQAIIAAVPALAAMPSVSLSSVNPTKPVVAPTQDSGLPKPKKSKDDFNFVVDPNTGIINWK